MRPTTKLAFAAAFVALAGCGSNNNANNAAEMNAGTELNTGTTEMNAPEMNAGEMNATGNMGMNETGAMNATGNTMTNNTM
jgi:hypothetical protein